MSNKRNLKRTINYVCRDLFAECIAASLYNGSTDEESVKAILSCIISLHDDFVRRISHPEPGMKAKKYYRVLTENFDKQASEIVDQISNLH